MTLTQTLFSLEGRINRSNFWLMLLLLVSIINVVGISILTMIFSGLSTAVAILIFPALSLCLFNVVGISILAIIFSSLSTAAIGLSTPAILIFLPLSLYLFSVRVAINVKRWHDLNKSGWWQLIELIPIIGSIWTVVKLGFLKGTDGPNRFGPDPLKNWNNAHEHHKQNRRLAFILCLLFSSVAPLVVPLVVVNVAEGHFALVLGIIVGLMFIAMIIAPIVEIIVQIVKN